VGLEALESDDFFENFTDLNSFQAIHITNIKIPIYQNDHSEALSGVLKKEVSDTV
jgi:hypothetical protein